MDHFFKEAEIVVLVVALVSWTIIVFICGRAWEYASPTKKRGERNDEYL